MNPSFQQRLGFAPVRHPARGRRKLFAARAGARLFVAEAALVLVAATAGGQLGEAMASIVAASGLAVVLAIVLVTTYERLNALGMRATAATSS